MQIGTDMKQSLIEFCSSSEPSQYNQALVDIQDTFNILDNLMCSDKCTCVKVDTDKWINSGYDISKANFTGVNKNIETCLSSN